MTATPLLLFLHIPKTGGTTLKRYLYSFGSPSGPVPAEAWQHNPAPNGVYYLERGFFTQVEPDLDEDALRDPSVKIVIGHFSHGIHGGLGRPARYVTLLREPVDRVLSLYHHLRTWQPGGLDPESLSLERFLAEFQEARNDQTRRLAGNERSSFKEVTRADLLRAKKNLREDFSLVGVTERFEEFLTGLRLVLELAPEDWDLRIEQLLVNPERPPLSAVPEAIAGRIAELNEFDLELYVYAARLFDAQLRGLTAERIGP